MGRIGAVIEPVVKPLGFDGRIGTAILTSFAAREVFNSSLAVIFRVDELLGAPAGVFPDHTDAAA
jgi:ferrous iron transport protein B